MDSACEFMWKYCIAIANVMEPKSIFSLQINNYSVFQPNWSLNHKEVKIYVVLTKLFFLIQLYDRLSDLVSN